MSGPCGAGDLVVSDGSGGLNCTSLAQAYSSATSNSLGDIATKSWVDSNAASVARLDALENTLLPSLDDRIVELEGGAGVQIAVLSEELNDDLQPVDNDDYPRKLNVVHASPGADFVALNPTTGRFTLDPGVYFLSGTASVHDVAQGQTGIVDVSEPLVALVGSTPARSVGIPDLPAACGGSSFSTCTTQMSGLSYRSPNEFSDFAFVLTVPQQTTYKMVTKVLGTGTLGQRDDAYSGPSSIWSYVVIARLGDAP